MIVTPTREIALQVSEYLTFLCKYVPSDHPHLSKPPVLLIGGLDIKDQRRKLLVERPSVAVGTPGRIKEMIDKEWLSLDSSLDTLIIDEADKFCYTTSGSSGSG